MHFLKKLAFKKSLYALYRKACSLFWSGTNLFKDKFYGTPPNCVNADELRFFMPRKSRNIPLRRQPFYLQAHT